MSLAVAGAALPGALLPELQKTENSVDTLKALKGNLNEFLKTLGLLFEIHESMQPTPRH